MGITISAGVRQNLTALEDAQRGAVLDFWEGLGA